MVFLWVAAMAAEAVAPKPIGDPGSWITSNDYPASELDKAVSGLTVVELLIDKDGSVTQCRTDTSSGSIVLDATACALIKARGRFTPGKDATGRRVEGIYRQRIAWVMPKGERFPLPTRAEVLAVAVDVDQNGSVERCEVVEGADMVAEGRTSPCVRFPAGTRLRAASGSEGKPVKYRLLIKQSTQFEPR